MKAVLTSSVWEKINEMEPALAVELKAGIADFSETQVRLHREGGRCSTDF